MNEMIDDPRCATKKKSLLFFLSGAGASSHQLSFLSLSSNQTLLIDLIERRKRKELIGVGWPGLLSSFAFFTFLQSINSISSLKKWKSWFDERKRESRKSSPIPPQSKTKLSLSLMKEESCFACFLCSASAVDFIPFDFIKFHSINLLI